MPRGKRITDEEKIDQIDKDINELEQRAQHIQEKINALIDQRNQLIEAAKQRKINKISEMLMSTGKTPEELEELIKKLA